MAINQLAKIIGLAFLLFLSATGLGHTNNLRCEDDSLSKNSNGEHLLTLSGKLFETLAGDSITASLWLPVSSLMICGPDYFSYKGQQYEIFKIVNTDSNESVSALLAKGNMSGGSTNTGCYEATITKPAPFMGNNGEVFVLSNGSIWEVKYEYEYMYEYYPTVIACPNKGNVIVRGKKLNAQRLK